MKKSCLLFAALVWVCNASNAAPKADYWEFWDKFDDSSYRVLDHAAWDGLLRRHVIDDGSGVNRFDYEALTDRELDSLDDYISRMAGVDPRTLNRAEAQAYWMNLYNALSVQAIRENYGAISAVTAGHQEALERAWSERRVKVARKKLSLDDIEHRILRPIWHDHRIHFGLNCASLGCPNMQARALTGRTLKAQLGAAGREFVNDERGVHFANGKLRVSSLFDWYRDDFAKDEKGLLKLFAYYADDSKALYLLGYSGAIDYQYDRRLNSP